MLWGLATHIAWAGIADIFILYRMMSDSVLRCAGEFDCGGSESKHIPCWQVCLVAGTCERWDQPAPRWLPYLPCWPRSRLLHLDCLLAQVNDDFCDCMSGKDEPGTSACSQQGASFQCSDGKVAIPTSFLQDGFRYSSSYAHPIPQDSPACPSSPVGCGRTCRTHVHCLAMLIMIFSRMHFLWPVQHMPLVGAADLQALCLETFK